MTSASAYASSDPMSARLAQNWWAVALRGLVAVVFGLCALFFTGPTMLSLVLVFAAYCLVDGVFGFVAAVRAARRHERWGLLVLGAVFNILAAAVAILWPGIAILGFVILVAAWAIVTGGLALFSAFRLRMDHGRWWMILGGAASLLFGVLLIASPLIGAVVLTWWIGAWALVMGISLLVLAFRLRPHRDDWHHLGGAAPHGV
jgi:uncharacterized membrane protein HdeD (DUF308 family)